MSCRHCTHCARQLQKAPPRCRWEWQEVLAILEGNRAWFVTLSDIAFWRYGDDGRHEIEAARGSIRRIRLEGYVLEERDLIWIS